MKKKKPLEFADNRGQSGRSGKKYMTAAKQKLLPMRLQSASKRDVRTQFGALCWRVRDGKVQILLITSRGTGRWIIPKGWPMDGATPSAAAATEAFEEAGVEGRISDVVLGVFSYQKNMPDEENMPCIAAVFPLEVKKTHEKWPEAKERRRKWFSQKKAAEMVSEPELAQLIRSFRPKALSRKKA